MQFHNLQDQNVKNLRQEMLNHVPLKTHQFLLIDLVLHILFEMPVRIFLN